MQKQLQTIQISDTEYGGNLMSTKGAEPTETTATQHPLSNQMIEQINIALEQKGSRFQPGSLQACRRRLTSEKRAYTSIKSDEE